MITTLNLIPQTDYMIIEETEVETQIEFQDRKRIGIIGGTFSPPRLGDLIVAQQVGEQLGLDKIYLRMLNPRMSMKSIYPRQTPGSRW